jgi:effector-binding domain-containing protein
MMTFGKKEAEMATQPEVVQRAEQPYVAIRALVTMQTLGEVLPGLHPEVRRWLRSQGVQPTGQPFFKFNVIDMDRQLEVEVGIPVATAMTGGDQVLAAVLPAGRYATLRHTGHPDTLIDATRTLLDWAEQQGLAWDVEETSEGQRWAARLQIDQDDPPPDMDAWETELAFRLAD